MKITISKAITSMLASSCGRSGKEPPNEGASLRTDGGELESRRDEGRSGAVEGSATRTPDSVGESPTDDLALDFHDLLHLTKAPLFVLDADGEVLVWNEGMGELTGSDEATAKAADQASQAWYHDGRRSMLLADKIIEAPERTDSEFDVEAVEEFDFPLYEDTSTFEDANGDTRYCSFSATPLYDGTKLVGVIEFVEDRTADVERQAELRGIVSEVTDSMARLETGDLSTRASIPEVEYADEELLDVVHAFNRMGERLHDTVESTRTRTDELESSARTVAEASQEVTESTDDQRAALERINEEVNTTSATIEEIAASTDQVASGAERTASLATEGEAIAEEAGGAMEAVVTAESDVVEEVEELQVQIEAIDEVVDVINQIADQTNLLALNASIEAAHTSDGSGDGFAVVAAEVKSLAEETQSRVDDIESMVTTVHEHTEAAVLSLDRMDEQVNQGQRNIEDAIDHLNEISTQATETADGIEEVARATDDQAASNEEIASATSDVTERAEVIAVQTTKVAETNRAHGEIVEEIRSTIERLTDDQ